jgi:large repetitive protein
VTSVHPNKAATVVPTVVTIVGERFASDATVTFDGTGAEIVEVTPLAITVITPVHPAATVDIVVTNGDRQTGRVRGGFVYENSPSGVPSVQAISPTLGVTTGGTSVEILGDGFHFGTSVTLDGVRLRSFLVGANRLDVTTPAHAPGVVDIVVVNPEGEARLPRAFTYAAPDTFDFNGTWKGQADGPPDSVIDISFTISGNRLIDISCGSVTVTLSPAPSVRGGEFSFTGEGGLALTGRMLSPSTATGEIRASPCGPSWFGKR